MTQERSAPAPWDVLTAELRAYREQQKQTWGDLDNALIGRYLAGEVNADERHSVEAALDNHPELRKLADLVLDVLNEFEAVPSEKPAPRPRLLSFTDNRNARRPFLSRLRERGALVAAACLLLALGVALLKAPGSGPVLRTAEKRGPEVARVSNLRGGPELSADDFPLPVEKVSSIKSAVVADASAPPEDIAKVASWTERRLKALPPAPSAPPRAFHVAAPAPAGAGVAAKGDARQDKKKLRRGEKRHRYGELGRAVPFLVLGLSQEGKPGLQNRCGKALERVAPYAGNAVPALTHALQCATCSKQQRAVVEVLKKLGPAANEAAPILEQLALSGPADVQAEAKDALCSVCVGVNDRGQVLGADACRRLNVRAAQLSRQHQLYFSAQTYRQRPTAPAWNFARQAPPHEGRRLSVVICAEPPTVEVALSPDLKSKDGRLSAETLRKVIQTNFQKKTPEKGLEEAVELVERSLAKR